MIWVSWVGGAGHWGSVCLCSLGTRVNVSVSGQRGILGCIGDPEGIESWVCQDLWGLMVG